MKHAEKANLSRAEIEKLVKENNYSLKEILANFNIPRTAAIKMRKELGLTEEDRLKKQESEKKIIEMYNSGAAIQEILSATVFASSYSIYRVLEAHGIKDRRYKKISDDKKNKIGQMHNSGKTVKEISSELKLDKKYIMGELNKQKGKYSTPSRHVINEHDIEQIIKLYKDGYIMAEISRMTKISFSAISNLLIEKGLRKSRRRKMNATIDIEREEKIIELYKLGESIKAIEKHLGIHNGIIYRVLYQNRLKKPNVPDDIMEEIYTLHKRKYTNTEISIRTGVGTSKIYYVKLYMSAKEDK